MELQRERLKSKRYRFARFELDPANFELRRDRDKVRLARLPLDLLILLVERRGTLVSRNTIVAELWQNPGLLETDQNINTAVRQIRAALGDDATHPVFVETVVGKGYRFISPTEEEAAAESSAVPEPVPISALPVVAPASKVPSARKLPVWFALVAVIFLGSAFWSVYRLRRVPTAALSQPRRLSSQVNMPVSAVLSPGGDRVAILRPESPGGLDQIFVRTLNSAAELRLTNYPGGVRCLAWSPGADRIAFLAADQKSDGIVWAVSLADRSVVPLVKLLNPGEYTWLDWSPDAKLLAVGDRGAVPGLFSISLVQIASNSRRQLTNPPTNSRGDSDPRFSPDGKMVAFRRNRGAGQDDLFVVSVADGKETPLTQDRRGIEGFAWTPDSKNVIVSSARASSLPSLWLFPLDAAFPPTRLTDPGQSASWPSVARTAKGVVWSANVLNTDVWRVAASGSSPPERVTAARYINQEPSVSRDGVLAFRSNRDGDDQIWIARADGSEAHPITHLHGGLAGSPRWSPDGRYLAFDSREQGNADIFIAACNPASLACEEPRQFTHDASADAVPGWSADSKSVYFASDRSGRMEIWRQLLFGSEAVQVTQNNGYAAQESPDGRWLVYSKLTEPIGFFRFPLKGDDGQIENGPEENIVPKMNYSKAATWAISGNELFYLDEFSAPSETRFLARNLDTGKTRTVLTLHGKRLARVIALSAGGDWIYYSAIGPLENMIYVADLQER